MEQLAEPQVDVEPIVDNKPTNNINEELDYDNADKFEVTTSDDITFTLTVGAARYSRTLRNLIKGVGINQKDKDGNVVPVPLVGVEAAQFSKILPLLTEYGANPPVEDKHTYGGEDREVLNTKLTDFDKSWVGYDGDWSKDRLDELAYLLTAADWLDAREVMDVVAQTMAEKLKDKTVADLIALFALKPEQLPTPEERAIIEKKYAFLKSD